MFKTRLLSGIVLIALALCFIITGNELLLVSTACIALIGLFELYRVVKIERTILSFAGYLASLIFYCNLYFNFIPDMLLFTIAYLVVLMFLYVFSYPKYRPEQVFAAFLGVFYVSVMLSFIYQTRQLAQNGEYLVWLIFLCSWGCDTSAYCVGKLCGKHKMTPILSPKKTWEGAIGGVVGAAVITFLYAFALKDAMQTDGTAMLMLVLIAAVGAVISMVGDLTASAIKRHYEIKDYGKLIPGHGGILDRFDSVIFTAPVIYYLAVYIL